MCVILCSCVLELDTVLAIVVDDDEDDTDSLQSSKGRKKRRNTGLKKRNILGRQMWSKVRTLFDLGSIMKKPPGERHVDEKRFLLEYLKTVPFFQNESGESNAGVFTDEMLLFIVNDMLARSYMEGESIFEEG